MASPPLIISTQDYERISQIIFSNSHAQALLLAEELDRASIVDEAEIPHGTVKINSKVRYLEVAADRENFCTLVLPEDAQLEQKKISVLAPIGAALIGLQVGQEIEWPMPNGQLKKIKILEVI